MTTQPQLAPAARRRLTVAEASMPALARSAKLRFDETRQRWVLLVPERVLAPDDTAVEILQLCDGASSVAAIIDDLAEKYAAPRDEIGGDVIAMLQDLANSGFLVEARESKP
ncbi:MAG TPA: pyrroloquinoline quinone biosynthesis peptide chaperone PqqD [Devosiaceae bacterium]|jgi:pyrroloquinoline quinone biosynthesis protein D